MIGKRLKEERERLKLTQVEFANLVGVSKRTLIDWEQEKTSPTAVQLASLSELCVNVFYVLTGQRAPVIMGDSVRLMKAKGMWPGKGIAGILPKTEEPDSVVLTSRETALLETYRNLDEDAKLTIEKTSAAFAQLKDRNR